MNKPELPMTPIVLGLAGILPQAICVAVAMTRPDDRWFVISAGCCYAALILSFLGGLWWLSALVANERRGWPYIVAVMPSLVGWVAMLPWCFGLSWPGPSLGLLGLCLLASPLIDRVLPLASALPAAWLRLRVAMASGIGLATLALAMLAP